MCPPVKVSSSTSAASHRSGLRYCLPHDEADTAAGRYRSSVTVLPAKRVPERPEGLGPLLIRADANAVTGTGHVGRCLALAQAWQAAGGASTFVMADPAPLIVSRLAVEDMAFAEAEQSPGSESDACATVELARATQATAIVLDGYQFDAAFQAALGEAGLLVVIDDEGGSGHYSADIVVNQNLHAGEHLYPSRKPSTRLLLGVDYALLRQEFLAWAGRARPARHHSKRVLVTLGGSDPGNVTARIVDGVLQAGFDPSVRVIAGPANPHQAELGAAVECYRTGGTDVVLLQAVDDMATEMAWADVAVSAAGSTCWELASMGIPGLVVSLAPNQRPIAAGLAQLGIVEDLGPEERVVATDVSRALSAIMADPGRRAQMAAQGRSLVDGRGAERVVAAIAAEATTRAT